MIIAKTPYRVSFFGGGSDYPDWYERNGGSVLGTSIGYYCYIHGKNLPSFFDHKYLISWSKVEKVDCIDKIEHPVVRESLRWMNIKHGMEVQHHGDLPARSGLGSSSSFTVSMLNMLHTLKGDSVSSNTLAKESIYLEQKILKENVGIQDQILTSHGGFNKVDILPNGSFNIRSLLLKGEVRKQIESNILMFYTGISRISSIISADYIKEIPNNETDLFEMQNLVDVATDVITSGGNIDDFGRLLHETWKIKRALSPSVTTSYINDIYNKGIQSGALGGKLLGAGGGGFIIFYVTKDKRKDLCSAMKDLVMVPFKIETDGASIIFNNRDGIVSMDCVK